MSHGCRSGLAVDDKTGTATGALVSVENYYFCFLPPTALPETRPWAARQPSWKPPWAAATDGRTEPHEAGNPTRYVRFTISECAVGNSHNMPRADG